MRVIAFVLLAAGWPAAGQPLALVENGKSNYSICTAPDAPPSEQRGAGELQRFLEEMSGARLPVRADCGPARGDVVQVGGHEELGPEGFRLKTDGTRLIISGGRQRGVMYGVYTLLDKLGCRWFTPEVSRIPKMRTIRIGPLDETQQPAFEYREPFVTEAFQRDWAARNRTNGAHSELDDSTGGKLQYYPFVHSFYEMIPPDKYFKSHPEYFSLIDGARRTERGQLCLTNPEVLRVAVAAVEEWIRRHPEAAIYSVSQNDWEGWCECDNCRRVEQEEGGQHSGPILRFVNALAAEIEKKHPDKLIDTLAYWYSENPPLHARPRPNVRIRLCPIGVCEAHPYEKCPRSAYFMRNLEAWSKITNQLYIWHYNTNFSHYLVPFPDFDELAADIPMYRRHGVVGVFLEGSYPKGGGGENAELRAYVMARLLWNPETDVNQAVDEFLAGVYGRAARPMHDYFDLLQRQARQGMHIWINPVPEFSDEFLREARGLFAQAEKLADDDAVRRRVRKARLPIEYLELLRAKTFAIEGDQYAPANLPALKDHFHSFMGAVRGFGMTSLHEGRDLAFDEREFTACKPYRVATIEDSGWRVDVAPELGGRIIRLIDKRTSRDLLRRPDSGERGYPNLGGEAASVYPDYHGHAWDVKWSLEPARGRIVLAGACDNGVKLRRRIEIRDGAVRVETTAENAGEAALDVALQVHADFDPGNIDEAVVSFRRRDGQDVHKKLIEPDQPPTGSETYTGSAQPDAAWNVAGYEARVENDEVARSFLGWTAKGSPRVTLGVWSPKRKLARGETLRLSTVLARLP